MFLNGNLSPVVEHKSILTQLPGTGLVISFSSSIGLGTCPWSIIICWAWIGTKTVPRYHIVSDKIAIRPYLVWFFFWYHFQNLNWSKITSGNGIATRLIPCVRLIRWTILSRDRQNCKIRCISHWGHNDTLTDEANKRVIHHDYSMENKLNENSKRIIISSMLQKIYLFDSIIIFIVMFKLILLSYLYVVFIIIYSRVWVCVPYASLCLCCLFIVAYVFASSFSLLFILFAVFPFFKRYCWSFCIFSFYSLFLLLVASFYLLRVASKIDRLHTMDDWNTH